MENKRSLELDILLKMESRPIINFGKVDKFILFGGGTVLQHLALNIMQHEIPLLIVTCNRQLSDINLQNQSFQDFLTNHHIPYIATEEVNKDERVLTEITQKTIGISFGATWIFKEAFIGKFNNKLINCHSRNLPKNRGGGGYSWLILNQEKESSTLLHLIDGGIDTGLIIKQKKFNFPAECQKPLDYEKYAFTREIDFFNEFLQEIINEKNFVIETQDESQSTYFPRLHSKTQGLIDWSWPAKETVAFINAFDDPYCGASTYYKDKKVFLKKCREQAESTIFHPFLSGVIYRIYEEQVFIASRNGAIVVSQVSDEDGNSILPELRIGQRFITPAVELEQARKFNPVYNSEGLKNKL